jgi:hypothetical protein
LVAQTQQIFEVDIVASSNVNDMVSPVVVINHIDMCMIEIIIVDGSDEL